jgi:hypothetical protein
MTSKYCHRTLRKFLRDRRHGKGQELGSVKMGITQRISRIRGGGMNVFGCLAAQKIKMETFL